MSGSFTLITVLVLTVLVEGNIVFLTSQMQGERGAVSNISYNKYPGMFEQKEMIENFLKILASKLSLEAVREALIICFQKEKIGSMFCYKGFRDFGFVYTSAIN